MTTPSRLCTLLLAASLLGAASAPTPLTAAPFGTDEATSLLPQPPLQFGDTVIPVGANTRYRIPSASGPSRLAFSSHPSKWGVAVDEPKDVARVALAKVFLPVEQLTLAVVSDPVPRRLARW